MPEEHRTIPKIILPSQSTIQVSESVDCGGGDCACSLASSTRNPDNWSTATPRSQYRSNFQVLHLNETHSICYNVIHNALAVLNRSALDLLSFFDRPHYLTDILDNWHHTTEANAIQIVLEKAVNADLLVPKNYVPPNLSVQPNTLTAWLHTTDRCNLRCDYCYLPHQKVDMSLETGQASVASTFRSALIHNYKYVKFKYAGGEPLLRFPLITQLHRYAKILAAEYEMLLDGIVLSNGTLLSAEIIKEIQELNLRLMISLDGVEKSQDHQRFYPGGEGSYANVIRGLELALKHGLKPHISITVTGRNAAALPDLMNLVLGYDLTFNLNFYRENTLSMSQSDLNLEEEKLITGMLAAYKIIESNLPQHNLLASLTDRADLSRAHLMACGAGHNYLVFDHQGHAAKCQMHIEQSVTSALADDPLTAIQIDQRGVQNISVDDKVSCCSCDWKYWCAGGCPVVTYHATGRYDAQSPNCSVYKALYPEVIRLEGLRLLKYSDP
jgi:uncharacterized protein